MHASLSCLLNTAVVHGPQSSRNVLNRAVPGICHPSSPTTESLFLRISSLTSPCLLPPPLSAAWHRFTSHSPSFHRFPRHVITLQQKGVVVFHAPILALICILCTCSDFLHEGKSSAFPPPGSPRQYAAARRHEPPQSSIPYLLQIPLQGLVLGGTESSTQVSNL